MITNLESSLKSKMESLRLQASGIDPLLLSAFKTNVDIQSIIVSEAGGERISNSVVNYAIGFLAGILIYTFILFMETRSCRG